ncbi:potassium-transporting ATPase subunit C [Streptomyces sp. NPDC050743]|uniref:potassium-transporting ATPase subunit C n=1 Tax=Streptomyces sp. NPDC050743 TaxID=3365634 RepID=UPI0037A112F9
MPPTRSSVAQQIARVAEARGLDEAKVKQLVDDHVQGRILDFLGEEHVNVVEINLTLSKLS